MLTITTNDGARFRARTSIGLVKHMKRCRWTAPNTKSEYMHDVAETVRAMYGYTIDPSSPEAFLNSLAISGMITIGGSDNA